MVYMIATQNTSANTLAPIIHLVVLSVAFCEYIITQLSDPKVRLYGNKNMINDFIFYSRTVFYTNLTERIECETKDNT